MAAYLGVDSTAHQVIGMLKNISGWDSPELNLAYCVRIFRGFEGEDPKAYPEGYDPSRGFQRRLPAQEALVITDPQGGKHRRIVGDVVVFPDGSKIRRVCGEWRAESPSMGGGYEV